MGNTFSSDGFDGASAQEKADMFDASDASPREYAAQNFHNGPDIPTTGVTVTGGTGSEPGGSTGAGSDGAGRHRR